MKRILIQIIIAMVVPFSAAFAPVSQNNIKTITTAATTTTLSAIRFEKETQTWFADDPVSYMAPIFFDNYSSALITYN